MEQEKVDLSLSYCIVVPSINPKDTIIYKQCINNSNKNLNNFIKILKLDLRYDFNMDFTRSQQEPWEH